MSRPLVLTSATGLDSIPDAVCGHMSSYLWFKEVACLLRVSKRIRGAVLAGETALAFPHGATDAAVIAMMSKFHNLTSMDLNHCSKVTDAGIRALAEHCPGLESLCLNSCSKVTDAGMRALAEHCPGLKSLDLADCSKVTDVGVQALAEHCPGLKSLDLGGCSKITLTFKRARRRVAEGPAADQDA